MIHDSNKVYAAGVLSQKSFVYTIHLIKVIKSVTH